MSTYSKPTKHPLTDEWEMAIWIDDFYGGHQYGVKFSDNRVFNPETTALETRHQLPLSGWQQMHDHVWHFHEELNLVVVPKLKFVCDCGVIKTVDPVYLDGDS